MNISITDLSSFTLVLFSFTLVLALATRSMRSKKPKGQLPPGPPGWPIIGHLFHVITNRPAQVWIHRSMEVMQTEIACFRFASVNVITVTSSEIALEVLREKDEALADRSESYTTNLLSHGYKDVAFSPYGESWKLMKKTMTNKLMSPATLNKTLGDRTLEADNIVTYLFNLSRSGTMRRPVNVRDIVLTYCHAVMMRMMFGQRHFDEAAEDGGLGPKEKEHMDAIYKALDCIFSFNVTNYIPFLRGWNIDGEEAEAREAVDILNGCNDPIIHERMRLWRNKGGKETEEDWLDILITLKNGQGMPLFTFDDIRAQCKDINVATIDNTMNNVEWTIAEMLNHPEILEKATNELDMVVGKDRLVQESDIPQLNYIKACSRESFRLHPANTFMPPHEARQDTTLAGYFVPKGSQILVSRLGLGRNPKIWDEPNVFKPERHLAGHEVNLMEPEMRFVTFGTGRRGCAGVKIGISMTIMLLARLLQGFEWTLPNGTSQVELVAADSNLFMAKPLLACAKPRLVPTLYPAIQNVLLGAINTSAITMTWAMAELVRNPRAMKKVQTEIRNQMGNKPMITLDDTDQLNYLKMVIKETWRLHPPAPLLVPREVMSEFKINGYKIQPKTRLYVNAYAIGRDPDIWKDPEMFLPERFMDNDIDAKGQNFELLPFGSGRRICPGMYMGTTMVEFGLANMLSRFDWELPEGMSVEDIDMEESPGLAVGKKNELLLVPVKFL
ncbi:unnamed protein product [Thlaspi arvense]|uniref:Cytochrome P450 n=1 Tax=Thlaspi arvense TaxID=13288 RepID=A0AAU9RKN3_THLAR|nr:unnamed protein product [Thlaspi arvense]